MTPLIDLDELERLRKVAHEWGHFAEYDEALRKAAPQLIAIARAAAETGPFTLEKRIKE